MVSSSSPSFRPPEKKKPSDGDAKPSPTPRIAVKRNDVGDGQQVKTSHPSHRNEVGHRVFLPGVDLIAITVRFLRGITSTGRSTPPGSCGRDNSAVHEHPRSQTMETACLFRRGHMSFDWIVTRKKEKRLCKRDKRVGEVQRREKR